MKIEVCLSTFNASWGQLADAAGTAEELGIGGLWAMDHLTGIVHERDHVLECFAVLGGLAAITSRARLGTLVANAGLRNPALLAQTAATLHDQTDGRFVLGVGAGGGAGSPYAVELERVGIDHRPDPIRRQRVEEVIDVVKHLWNGNDDTYVGSHHRVGPAEGFMQPQVHPPVLVAGFGPKMAALAGRKADMFNTIATHPDLEMLFAAVRDSAEQAQRAEPERTVFSGDERHWLDPYSPERKSLDQAAAQTLVMILYQPFDRDLLAAIAEASEG
ncbi:MAG: LLM class flavin-dependent oxidoreductase [Acidimicrobiales bacterium]